MAKTFSRAEVTAATLDYFSGDDLAADAFVNKYALRDPDDLFLEKIPDDMHRRLAREFARIESKYPNPMSEDEIYRLFARYRYVVPQGSPMSAIGNPYQIQSLSNCFVIDSPHDSYGGIFTFDQEEAQIMKRRGGVGGDVSSIRPRGMVTSNAAKTTDGLAVFMQRFSNTCREVAQDGRRGALMLTCFAPDTLVLTRDGDKTIKEIVETKYSGDVWTHEGWQPIEAYQKIDDRSIYEIECENGKKIKVTADHEFVVKNVKTGEESLKAIKDVDPDVEELVFYDAETT